MQEPRRWINQSQPQTLQIAVFLLYADAAFAVFYMLLFGVSPVYSVPVAAGGVAAGFGIANEKKWGYVLGVVMAFFPFAFRVLLFGVDGLLRTGVLNLMFEIALVALLLHTQSREYQRIWFK
jgi:predicted membrane channel-forming protein YqfA (hemolysin III family)